ncbi:MAG: cyanophycinase [Myxococcales bacterium]
MQRVVLTLLALLVSVPALAAKPVKVPYTYVRVGQADVTTPSQYGIALMGGAYDVDEGFRWMCDLSGNGDFLTIRAAGTIDEYNDYVPVVCPNANSVATLIIPSLDAANHPDVAAIISKAEAIFVAGGDQSLYVNYWIGTPVQTALQERLAHGIPVGGISAGLAVLSQYIYSAQLSQGAKSPAALADPFNRYMTLAKDLFDIPFLKNVIADTHFSARDRMGRSVAFLGRLSASYGVAMPRGVAVDERMAVLVDAQGIGTVVEQPVEGTTPNHVYFLAAPGAPEVCVEKTPLTYRNIAVQRLGNGETFDLNTWAHVAGFASDFAAYQVSAEAGVLSSTQAGGSVY